ncbi:unnamed protein product [Urochloa decumbens]|uniref:Uncharacterized protein n=1 Tax=Urochloa decumbens TaxID=240449 RepID=A0ABC8ZBY4_9POAL
MAATTTDGTSVFTIKLVVDTRYRRVLFAKITTDVVDFLHALLISPDTPVSLDDMACWAGCTDNIVASVEELDYLVAEAEAEEGEDEDDDDDENEDAPPSPPPQQQQQARRRFFVCRGKRGAGCDVYLAERSDTRCPSCGWLMDAEAPRDSPGAGCSWPPPPRDSPGAGCSWPPPPPPRRDSPGAVTCTLMDDLSIGPTPDDILGLAIMKGASAAAFQEETVRLGRKEGLKILKASLKSKTVLTEVFLRDEAPAAGAPIRAKLADVGSRMGQKCARLYATIFR